jgi:hypothetical protein
MIVDQAGKSLLRNKVPSVRQKRLIFRLAGAFNAMKNEQLLNRDECTVIFEAVSTGQRAASLRDGAALALSNT